MMLNLPALITLFACACAAFATESVIVSGYLWKDTSGNVIQAHGAGMLKVSSWQTASTGSADDVVGRVDVLLVRGRQVGGQHALQGGFLLRGSFWPVFEMV